MNKFLSITVAAMAATLSFPALANGILPAPDPAPAYVVPAATDWSGGYVGAYIGYGTFEGTFCDNGFVGVECDNLTDPGITQSIAPSGALLGLSAGYDWQRGNMVYGVVGDIGAGDIFQNDPAGNYSCGPLGCELSVNWLATLRGRVGTTLSDNMLAYATAGVALTNVTVNFPSAPPSADDTGTNFIAGLGVDIMATDNISVGLEYLHLFERNEQLGEGSAGSQDFGVSLFNADVVRINVAYRF